LNTELGEPRQETFGIFAARVAEMIGCCLADLRQEAPVLVDLSREEIAVARHAVAVRMKLHIHPRADDLMQFVRLHEVQEPIAAHAMQVDS